MAILAQRTITSEFAGNGRALAVPIPRGLRRQFRLLETITYGKAEELIDKHCQLKREYQLEDNKLEANAAKARVERGMGEVASWLKKEKQKLALKEMEDFHEVEESYYTMSPPLLGFLEAIEGAFGIRLRVAENLRRRLAVDIWMALEGFYRFLGEVRDGLRFEGLRNMVDEFQRERAAAEKS